MKVYFGGAEKGSHRSMLLSAGVERLALNLTHFAVPKRKQLDLTEMFKGGEVILYTSETDEDLHRFDTFVRDHIDSLTYVIGRPDYDGAWMGEKYIPIWNDSDDLERLTWLCQKYPMVAVSDKAITGKNMSRIGQVSMRWGTKLIGMTSKPDLIERMPWDAVVVGSWSSALRYGETQVWDGHTLHRYPAQQKESARKRHRADIVRLGVNFDAVMDDEVNAVAFLAIRSWQSWESKNFGGYDLMNVDDEQEFNNSDDGQNIMISGDTQNSVSAVSRVPNIVTNVPEKRHGDARTLLPVMGIETITSMGTQTADDQGNAIEIAPEQVNVVRYNASPLRQCNHCYLASRCPQFQENTECAFSLPIEIKTKDQLNAAMRALVEMQVGRVMFARFAEEMEGQGIDTSLSAEMDRVFAMVEKMRSINDSRDTVSFTMEARGSSGVLSRLFGAKAGEQARQLPNGGYDEQATNDMYADIIDLSSEEG
jgi:hypothetical protein